MLVRCLCITAPKCQGVPCEWQSLLNALIARWACSRMLHAHNPCLLGSLGNMFIYYTSSAWYQLCVYGLVASERGKAGWSGLCPCCPAFPLLSQSIRGLRDWARVLQGSKCIIYFGCRHPGNQRSETIECLLNMRLLTGSHMATFKFSCIFGAKN